MYNNQKPKRGSDGKILKVMTIAKGRTNCKAERDLVFQGFTEQIQILEASQVEQENLLKARLYDVITDTSLSEEEKETQQLPWHTEFQELEEKHTRIRRSLFIGLYSFWEVSLLDIVNTHITDYLEKLQSLSKESWHKPYLGAKDYAKLIYEEKIPENTHLINQNICEFRNYMVHGSSIEKRESYIKELSEKYPEFYIEAKLKSYFISDYNGLKSILSLFSRELDNAENKILKSKSI